jgi:hypothetical protein
MRIIDNERFESTGREIIASEIEINETGGGVEGQVLIIVGALGPN